MVVGVPEGRCLQSFSGRSFLSKERLLFRSVFKKMNLNSLPSIDEVRKRMMTNRKTTATSLVTKFLKFSMCAALTLSLGCLTVFAGAPFAKQKPAMGIMVSN